MGVEAGRDQEPCWDERGDHRIDDFFERGTIDISRRFGRHRDVHRVPDACPPPGLVKRSGSYLQPNRHYAIGIGCEIAHADRLVYSEGVPLDGPAARIGISCRICERTDCQQRAFPPLDRRLLIHGNERRVVPYGIE